MDKHWIISEDLQQGAHMITDSCLEGEELFNNDTLPTSIINNLDLVQTSW